MPTLPANSELLDPAVTQAQFKAKLGQTLDFQRGLLGGDGTSATARAALGLADVPLVYPDMGAWATGASYNAEVLASQGGIIYRSMMAHIAGVFATDYAAGKWIIHQGATKEQAQIEGAAAGIAAVAPQVIIATEQAVISTTQAGLSAVAKTAAEAARDASLIQAGVYVDEPTGRAAVANGAYFKVQGTGSIAAYEYRRIDAVTVSTLIATYPSKSAYDAVISSLLLKADLAIGKNLFNPSASDFAPGNFVLATTGALQVNALYNCSGYILVVAGSVYTVSEKFYIAWYTSAKVFISGTSNTDTNHTLTAPAGAAFIRVSFSAINTNFQIEAGSVTTSYEAYGVYLLPSEIKARSLTNLMHAIGSISPDLTNFITPGRNLFNKATILANSFMGADGGIFGSQPTFFVTDYIKVQSGSVYTANKTMRFTTFFDSGKGFVAGGASANSTQITVPAGVSYVRLTFSTADLAAAQFELGSASTAYETFGFMVYGPNGELIIPPIPADGIISSLKLAAAAVTNAKLADSAVSPLKTNFFQVGKNRFNRFASGFVANSFMGSDGTIVGTQPTFAISDFIPVVAGTQYYGKGSGGNGMRFTTYFDANKNVVAGGASAASFAFTAPSGVAFVRVTLSTVDITSFQLEIGASATAYQAYGYNLALTNGEIIFPVNSTPVTLWAGKLWASLGDSITNQNAWQPNVAMSLGMTHTNFGVSGTTLSGASGSTTAMCQDARINAIPTPMDLITVLGGTNDWAQNIPLGTVASTDPTTFYGAIYTLVTKLLTRFPASRIVMMTTTYGELYARVTASPFWTNAYTNSIGLTTRDYADAIRIACKYHGIPCIDTQGKSGWNATNIRTFINDDGALLHPNTLGGNRMSEVVRGELRSIEPVV
jgi:hypothetical protein